MLNRSNPELVEEMRWQLQKIQERKAENERLMGALGKADAELGTLRATATSPDRTVTVIASTGGMINEVRLTDAAMRTDASALGRTITATVHEALASAARQQVSVIRGHVGKDIDPREVLGPQARFLEMPAEPARHNDGPGPAPATPAYDDEPVSESDAFLRSLGMHDDC